MRVLVIGHGLIGKQRAKSVAELAQKGGVSLAGTVDPAARDASLYGGAPHFASMDAVATDAYDAAIVAVPHNFALPICERLFMAGKPVLLEKPLGLNLGEAKAIHAASKRAKLPSFVGYNYRFLPTMKVVYERFGSGELGALRSVDMFLGHGGHPKSADEWKLKPEAAGGGVLIDPGVHLFDLLLTLAPNAELSHVDATRGFWKTGIEEDVVAVLRRDKLLATIRVSLIRWVNTFRMEFVGDDGYVLVEGRGGNYGAQIARVGKRWGWNDGSKRAQKETEEVHDFGVPNVSLHDEVVAVLERWRGAATSERRDPHPATMDEALRVAELCDAMYAKIG